MGDWTNSTISTWTLCVWESWFERLSELAEEGKSLDEEDKIKKFDEISRYAKTCAKKVINHNK